MTAIESKTLGECLPTTKEGLEVWIRDWLARTKNYQNCATETEEDFLHGFYKLKADAVTINGQSTCQTRIGQKRPDFVLTVEKRKIGFEIDGKDFHDKERDRIRDEAILETGFVDVIYRVPAKSMWFHTYDVLDLLRGAESFLYSNHGNQLLDAILDDGAEREDKWNSGHVIRTLKRKSDEEDNEELTSYIFLTWRKRK